VAGTWLSAYVFVRIEDFGKSLQAQVVVPCLRKADMLLVQLNEIHVVVADDVATPLLNGDVIVAPILCEAPGYVKWDEMRLVAFSEFTGTLNIVRLTVPGNVEGLSFECVLRTFRDAFRHTEGRFIK
jgi:hypothetical protein